MKQLILIGLITLTGMNLTARAQFMDIDFGDAPYTVNAEWSAFLTVNGSATGILDYPDNTPNFPDTAFSVSEPFGFSTSELDFNAYDSTWETDGAFLTSSRNIYSFSSQIAPVIHSSLTSFAANNVVLQVQTLGSTPDAGSFAIHFEIENDLGEMESVSLAADFVEFVSSTPLGGDFGGFQDVYAVQWDLTDPLDLEDFSLLDADFPEFSITFLAAESSMSLDALQLDFSGTDGLAGANFLQFVVPEPSTGLLLLGSLGALALRRRKV